MFQFTCGGASLMLLVFEIRHRLSKNRGEQNRFACPIQGFFFFPPQRIIINWKKSVFYNLSYFPGVFYAKIPSFGKIMSTSRDFFFQLKR